MAQRWAITCSMFANVHFRGSEAWEPDHFLGKKRRAPNPIEDIRAKMRGHNHAQEQLEVMQANAALAHIDEDALPAWATMSHPNDSKEQAHG